MASSLAAWAQNSILKGAGGGESEVTPAPGTVLPGVPQALKVAGKSLWTRVFEDFRGCGGDPEKPISPSRIHSAQIHPIDVMYPGSSRGEE